MREGIGKASDIRCPQAEFATAMQNMHARILRAHLLRQLAGAVGRMVIDNQNIGCWRVREDLLEQRGQFSSSLYVGIMIRVFIKQLTPYDKLRVCVPVSLARTQSGSWLPASSHF